MRRGMIFTIDALLAALILIGGLLLILQISDHPSDTTQVTAASQDLASALDAIRINEMDEPWVAAMVANGTIADPNITAMQQIGHFWATGEVEDARMLASVLLDGAYPSYGMHLTLENTTIYGRNSTKGGRDTIASSRMVSGVAEGKAITGSSAVAYLRRIKDKRTSSFLLFGGFVGQGNITAFFPALAADANITSLVLELDVGAPFRLDINNQQCGGDYVPTTVNFTPDVWDITSCASSLTIGDQSNVTIRFLGEINASYIAGGYLRAKYKTDSLAEVNETGTVRYSLPGIDGIINLYDALYVPGTLKNMTLRLHYNSSFPTYFTIGGSQVYWSNSSGVIDVTLDDANLTSFPALLDYGALSNKTIPIRMASYNETMNIIIGSNADVVLITDRSGSMGWRLDADWQQGNKRSCGNPDVYHKDDTERLSLAKCLDTEFTDITMNASMPNNQNRQWLVTFSDSAQYYTNDLSQLTHDNLVAQIGTYKNPSGGTCIACSLNLAYNILDTYSTTNKTRFVVLMTDGIPTSCVSGYSSCNLTGTGVTGTYSPAACVGDSSDCSGGDCGGPIQASINAARRLRDDLNASVYTIGVGPLMLQDCTNARYLLETIANSTNGSYYASRNATRLREIYREIAYDILERSGQTSQTVTVSGDLSSSTLYPDSYLEMNYEPAAEATEHGELTITLQSEQFQDCDPAIQLPSDVRFLSGAITSYSQEHWTDLLVVNGTVVYNLSDYDASYVRLGDPYRVHVPPALLHSGTNPLLLNTADEPGNSSGCSPNNTLIYSVAIDLSTERSTVVPDNIGCEWMIEFEDRTFENITVPSSYSGSNRCSYTNDSISYDPDDAYQLGAYTIFNRLDFRKDGRLFVNLRDEDLEVIVTTISRVPYMWGPSTMRLEVIR